MRNTSLVLLAFGALLIAACGSAEKPQSIQAIPDNAADMTVASIESVQVTEGLSSKTILQGEGAVAQPGQMAVVHYTGWLYDPEAPDNRGQKFDSSVDRGAHFRFPIGAGRVIRGWDEGVVGMKVGEVRELTIAPEMGYGDRGAGGVIPPGATLVFVVELAGLEGTPSAEQSPAN
jgi:FKBP-type peptidyl-prolyl cis-trans isomerase FkpA